MNKKIMITVALIAVFALAIPAFAATVNGLSADKSKKINQLQQQMIELRMQMVDEFKAAGQIDDQRADFMKNNMQLRMDYLQQNPESFGPMGLRGGRGYNGNGRGMGAGTGDWSGCPYYQQTPNQGTVQ
ncbi:MAG: DUF2680 domain-containing protein [Firmicutes bacterium]|nr:DUF2680 domain-containing protein [Bacillota bacterium]